ncbi:MAG: transglutaminase domain-containing protein, partial [Gammaproteobacteria bacterium]|nr:transglutaminase domain-containing protein [Gammaproteobacteria bacterium]
TTRYEFGEPGSTVTRELPRDIYYWYVVHPKVTDENVYYIHPNSSDPNTPTDPSQGGRFWREYLFFHNDSSYPADNSGSTSDGEDDYPLPGIGPPLLKDLLEGVDVLFNGTTWFAPGGNYSRFQVTGEDDVRPLDYGNHAVIRVSNWVGKTLILNQQEVSDGERPIQPVRIAHHHNGNCGELQDLTTAAARTALIPATGVLLLGEDHVWIEFYENGWHQWDNYWSDGGSVIDNFNNYWVGWGERGGSGIHKHNGDDDAWEVTDQYIPEEDLNYVTLRILDNNGDPVDGARVLVISYWLKVNVEGFQVEIPFPCIWNYTDSNGETLFKLATQERANGNHNFTFKIISKVGSTESGKIELEHGQDYTFMFYLEGSAPEPELDYAPQSNPNPLDPRFKLGVNYQVIQGLQRPRNLLTGHYHPQEIPPEETPESPVLDFLGNHIDSFITTGQEISNFLRGYSFESYEFSENSNSNSLEFVLTEDDDWYFTLSNRDSIETTKVVELNLELLFKPPPYSVKIVEPVNGAHLQIGGIIAISGIVTNETELMDLEISTDGGSTWTSIGVVGNEWTYYWNTASLD